MSKSALIIATVLLLLGVGGYYVVNNMIPTTTETNLMYTEENRQEDGLSVEDYEEEDSQESKKYTVELNVIETALNQGGTATLEETENGVLVSLLLYGYTTELEQPAHVHIGGCPGIGDVAYPLEPVVNGESSTTLGVTMEELKAQLPLAINVHKSANEVSVYTSCGDLVL